MLSFFPRDVLDEILDLIESVSDGFLTYFCICCSRISVSILRKLTVTCLSHACFTGHGTTISEFVVRRFNNTVVYICS